VLASVLTPALAADGSVSLEILASHAEDPELQEQYDRLGAIWLAPGSSLISRYVDEQAIISDERLLKPLFIEDLSRHDLQNGHSPKKWPCAAFIWSPVLICAPAA